MKKFLNFKKHLKHYFIISAVIMLIGLICNFIFPAQMDIKFTGGAMLRYSYEGEIDQNAVETAIADATGKQISTSMSQSMSTTGESLQKITINFNDKNAVNETVLADVLETLQKEYPDSNFTFLESNSVDPVMGREFFIKCIVAVILASLFMVLYVSFRFRKIGGWSAGVSGIIAIIHDLLIVYFVFVIFRFPLDDNFIAVLLSIIGFSLNDTIVIFDRVRENRRIMGPKATYEEIATTSTNQTLGRTVNTSVAVLAVMTVVTVIAVIFGIDSIVTFAIPMMIGVISGCYSSICIAPGLWVLWNEKLSPKFSKKKKKK